MKESKKGVKEMGSLEIAFGRVLQQLRGERGLSQEELGFRSGYHRTYISLLERGLKNPSLRTIFELAEALEAGPSQMILSVEHLFTMSSRNYNKTSEV
jgi:transcriptional regulator with XRE-family HTH domain